MTKDMGAPAVPLGSRASTEPVPVSAASGFDPSRVEYYARRLTESQRRNLLALPWHPEAWATVSELRHKGATGAGMDLLFVYHLEKPWRVCERRWVRWGSESGQKRGEGYEYRITPFGLAVRAHASAMSTGTTKTAKPVEGRSPASAVAKSDAPDQPQ